MKDEKTASHLASQTPARINVGRAGSRPRTETWLGFRADHASARDSVLSDLSQDFMQNFVAVYDLPVVTSLAENRANFVLNPPQGKKLDPQVLQGLKETLQAEGKAKSFDVQIVIADGLSSRAVEANLEDLYPMLIDGFAQENISLGKAVVVRQGRVVVADQIAHALGAKVAINLIGERPGLSSAQSLSAYITYNPGPQTISSDRTVVSNIHSHGTPAVEAGAFIVKCTRRILDLKASGVKLQLLG